MRSSKSFRRAARALPAQPAPAIPEALRNAHGSGLLRNGIAANDWMFPNRKTATRFIVDRKKDLIISGGFNIYPREVEDALTNCPGVKMAAVVGFPDNYRGETVGAAVSVDPGPDISKEAIIAHIKTLKGVIHTPK